MDPANNPLNLQNSALERLVSIREVVLETWQREVRARVRGAANPRGPAMGLRIHSLFDEIARALFGSRSAPAQNRMPGEALDSQANLAPATYSLAGVGLARVGPDQIAHEFHVFKEALAACAGQSWLNVAQWRAVDRIVDAATRDALRALLDEEDDARRRTAAALSHDMRTPLAVIASGAQLISIAPSLNAARSAALKIEANATRLSDMIGDLLDALTLQTGTNIALKLSRFDAFELAKDVRDQYLDSGARAIAFEAEGAAAVGYWCRDALRRALENLVNNAIKYGDGGLIHIGAREEDGRLILSVRNSGAPIPIEMREDIFQYLRRDKRASSTSGWGIGLPFVKAVAEGHGGEVRLESTADRGTAFCLHLPLDCRAYVEAGKTSA